MTPKYRARKYKKLMAQITKLTQQEYCVVVRKAGSTVGHNTPELGKEQPPREEKLGTQFRPQGTPNGERR